MVELIIQKSARHKAVCFQKRSFQARFAKHWDALTNESARGG